MFDRPYRYGYSAYPGNPYGQRTVPPEQPFNGYQNNGYQNQQFNTPQKPTLSVPWVNGEVGAQAYMIAPNSAVLLMDSDNPIFYIKTSELDGRASIQAFRYEELKQTPPAPAPSASYVTKEEFEAFKNSIFNKGAEENKEENK